MGECTLKDLLEAGVHFGHQTKRWNPKMKPFIFAEKNGIHIIDLQKTLELTTHALTAVRKASEKGQDVMFVGTKPQAKNAIHDEATRSGVFDWRDELTLGNCRNQGSCGSCWAFASAGVLEAAWQLRNKETIDASEQHILSCSGHGTCQGGWWAFPYLVSSGTETETANPITGSLHGTRVEELTSVAFLVTEWDSQTCKYHLAPAD